MTTKPRLVTADELQTRIDNRQAGDAPEQAVPTDEIRRVHEARRVEMLSIIQRAQDAGRDQLLASEERDVNRHRLELDKLQLMLDDRVDRSQVVFSGTGRPQPNQQLQDGVPLARDMSFEQWMRARPDVDVRDQEDLSLGKIVRGVVLGEWKDAGKELRAMTGAVDPSGGYLIPEITSARIIDLARNKTRIIEAGAQIIPMANREIVIPKWVTDPTPAWRQEGDTISESDATMGAVKMIATTLAVLTKVTRELIEDTDIEQQLRMAYAKAIALSWDAKGLYGTGLEQPLGVKSLTAQQTSMGTNGGAIDYDDLVDAVGKLEDANEEPTAIIYAPRTDRELAKLKDSTGQYLAPPQKLAKIPRLSTNQVPTNLTQGSASTASDVFVGDWTQMFVGVRTQLSIQVLRERYADTGEIGLLAWWRGDVMHTRASAFRTIVGVIPPS